MSGAELPLRGRVWRPSPWFAAAGLAYGIAAHLRNRLFDLRILRDHKLPVPVISVGNLTAGGTGKTPLVLWCVEELRRLSRKPGVLARGYGRAREEALNDEGLMLASAVPGLPQVQDPDRVRGGNELVRRFGVDAVVLDDGFQHRRIQREMDFVCLDARSPFGGGRCLPAGYLRERPWGLRRATALVLTRAEDLTAAAEKPLVDLLKRLSPHASVHRATHAPLDLWSRPDGRSEPPEALKGRKVLLFSGIGNPSSFEETVRRLRAVVLDHVVFEDHHRFREEELSALAGRAAGEGASLLTTEKDEARLFSAKVPRTVLRVRLRFLSEPPCLDLFEPPGSADGAEA